MKLSCIIGHKWNGCTCERCGQTRDEGHDFRPGERACREKCAVCGRVRDTAHLWQGCKCERCGATRATGHDYRSVEGAPIVRCERCGGTAVPMGDIARTDMQAIFTALEAGHFSLAQQQITGSMTADLSALEEIEQALSAASEKVSPFNMKAATGVLNGAYGNMTYADLMNLHDKTQAILEVIRQKMKCLTDTRSGAASGQGFDRDAYLAQKLREGKITEEGIRRMNQTRALRPLVTEFATYVDLTMDQSRLDEMEAKLLAEGEIGSKAVFGFLLDCGYGRLDSGVMWWKQAKRLTRMLPKFADPRLKDQLKMLVDLADRTNVWEYHTEIADVAKEELAKL